MIVRMNKVHLIFHTSQVEKNLKELQNLGVLDIVVNSLNTDNDIGKEYLAFSDAIDTLSSEIEYDGIDMENSVGDNSVENIVVKINQLQQEKLSLLKHNEELQSQYEIMRNFGNVSTSVLESLTDKGIKVDLYKSDKKLGNYEHDDNIYLQEIETSQKWNCIAVIKYNNAEFTPPVAWSEFVFPTNATANELHSSIETNNTRLKEIQRHLQQQSIYYRTIKIKKLELENILMRQEVQSKAEIFLDDELFVVQGFIPKKDVPQLEQQAKEYAWGIVISVPSKEDEVPTLIKNFPTVKIIQPLFKLMDTIPGYREFDISGLFLLFITLFFSMIIGDAGYGSIMFIITLVLMLKPDKRNRRGLVYVLLLWFSFSTIVWGALTGNWFGYFPLAEIPFLKQFILHDIAVNNPSSKETIMLFCFRVGLLHLCIAHLWKAIRVLRDGIFAVINELANGLMLFGLYFVTLFLLLDPTKYPLPDFALPAILGGFGLIVLTCEQEKGRNFFVGVLKGVSSLFTLFLGGVGALADLISYIRLFAVGLASLAIAQAFNTMGTSIMQIGASSSVVTIVLLVAGMIVIGLGHALNLAMALLAVMVHGVRLNMLEFGMHLGMEWTGRRYTPFQQKQLITLEE